MTDFQISMRPSRIGAKDASQRLAPLLVSEADGYPGLYHYGSAMPARSRASGDAEKPTPMIPNPTSSSFR